MTSPPSPHEFRLPRMALTVALCLSACTGKIGGATGGGPSGAGASSSTGVAGTRGTGVGGTGTTGSGSAGSSGPAAVDNGLPGRSLVRRLSNTEYDATIATLLGDSTGYAS